MKGADRRQVLGGVCNERKVYCGCSIVLMGNKKHISFS